MDEHRRRTLCTEISIDLVVGSRRSRSRYIFLFLKYISKASLTTDYKIEIKLYCAKSSLLFHFDIVSWRSRTYQLNYYHSQLAEDEKE